MGAYMYSIKINKEPIKIRYVRQIELHNDGVFTLSEINEYVKEGEIFSIVEKENSIFGSYILSISGERMETNEETLERIKKEENYMNEYNKRKLLKTIKK